MEEESFLLYPEDEANLIYETLGEVDPMPKR
jgi:hypothetical protein